MRAKPLLTYKAAGVNIDAGQELVERIKGAVARTRRVEVLGDLGGFGGLLMLVYDQSENNAAWEHSTRLLAENVMPRVSDLTGAGAG